MKAQNDPTGKMSTSQKSQAARQTLMKIQHLWNTYDNLSDCYVYLQEWQNALLVVDNTLKVCQLVLSWERRLNEDPDDKTSSSSSSSSSSGRSPEGPTSTAGAPGKKQSPPVVDAQVRAAVQGIRKRRAGTLVSKGHLLQVSLSLGLKGLYLYTGGVLRNVEWYIRQPLCSSIILYSIITSIAYNDHTNIYPLLNIHIYCRASQRGRRVTMTRPPPVQRRSCPLKGCIFDALAKMVLWL